MTGKVPWRTVEPTRTLASIFFTSENVLCYAKSIIAAPATSTCG